MRGSGNILEAYKYINRKLASGALVYFNQKDGTFTTAPQSEDGKLLFYPRIGIYIGRGASHSWLWFCEILDRMGLYDICFVDELDIQRDTLETLNVLLVSGGDTFGLAEGLGELGAKNLKQFILQGGLYIGSCAGAYLLMKSSISPLDLFNLAEVKIKNLSKTLPKAICMQEKFCTPYGCSYVFHPIREEIRIKVTGIPPFYKYEECEKRKPDTRYQIPASSIQHPTSRSPNSEELIAPLYGGPSMLPSQDATTLAYYAGFTPKTLFLADEDLAYKTLIGKVAAVKKSLGRGTVYLFGPHFEHPHYPQANRIIADAIYGAIANRKWLIANRKNNKSQTTETISDRRLAISEKTGDGLLKDLKRELSNSRIISMGLEKIPIWWEIGKKVYEPAKIRLFLEAMWSRLKTFEEGGPDKDKICRIIKLAKAMTRALKQLKAGVNTRNNTTKMAEDIFSNLKKLTSLFLEAYFCIKLFESQKGA